MMDLAWAAGFIEGEGTFVKVSKGFGSLSVKAVQKDPETLYRLQRMFGGTVNLQTWPSRQYYSEVVYTWQIGGAMGLGVAFTLFSLMSARRKKQIHKALSAR